jgi:hypothetical protein
VAQIEAPVQSTRGAGLLLLLEATVSTRGVAIIGGKAAPSFSQPTKYGHAPAAAPRCPSKPSAASQACCIAIS